MIGLLLLRLVSAPTTRQQSAMMTGPEHKLPLVFVIGP